MRGARRLVIVNVSILAVGVVGLLCLAESYLRLRYDSYDALHAAKEKDWFRGSEEDVTRLYTLDPALGFRPVLGNSVYSEHGTLRNDYAVEKRPGVTRVLFLGDSVTVRGKIVAALREQYGDEDFEYWNAGVASFNTVQEVEFFKRFNASVDPDHVILTFHNNDFETTPLAFRTELGRLVMYSPFVPRESVNAWLFENVMSYRALLGLRVRGNSEVYRDRIVAETRRSLRELSETVAERGIELTVLILPILDRYEDWRDEHRENHAQAVELVKELGLRYFDLSEPLREAFDDGVNPREAGDDIWHPNAEAAGYFGRYLRDHGLLDSADRNPFDVAHR